MHAAARRTGVAGCAAAKQAMLNHACNASHAMFVASSAKGLAKAVSCKARSCAGSGLLTELSKQLTKNAAFPLQQSEGKLRP